MILRAFATAVSGGTETICCSSGKTCLMRWKRSLRDRSLTGSPGERLLNLEPLPILQDPQGDALARIHLLEPAPSETVSSQKTVAQSVCVVGRGRLARPGGRSSHALPS